MGTYASALGVDPSLETLAQWVSWADSAHTAQDDSTAQYNLSQFWTAEAALDPALYQAHTADVVYLDALSHRVSAYIYMRQLVNADPADMAGITDNIEEQFSLSSTGFSQSGHAQAAADDAAHAQTAAGDAVQVAANYVDASYTTALKDQYNQVLSSAGSLLSSAGGALALLQNPVVLIAAGAAALFLLVKR